MSCYDEIALLQEKFNVCDLSTLVTDLKNLARGEFVSYDVKVDNSVIVLGFLNNHDFKDESTILIDTNHRLITIIIGSETVLKVELEDITSKDLLNNIFSNVTEGSPLSRLFGVDDSITVTSETLLNNIRGAGLKDRVREVMDIVKGLAYCQVQKFNKALEGLKLLNQNVYVENELFLGDGELTISDSQFHIRYNLHRYESDTVVIQAIFGYNFETGRSELDMFTPDKSDEMIWCTSRDLRYYSVSANRGLAGMLSDR